MGVAKKNTYSFADDVLKTWLRRLVNMKGVCHEKQNKPFSGRIPMIELQSMSESQHQQLFVSWLENNSILHYAVKNEGKRSLANGARMKSEGLRKGVPDLCIPVMRGGYGGLYIEMKDPKERLKTPRKQANGYLKSGGESAKQIEWIMLLREQGYKVEVCYTWEEARYATQEYLALENPLLVK